jgi:hypothetical protein
MWTRLGGLKIGQWFAFSVVLKILGFTTIYILISWTSNDWRRNCLKLGGRPVMLVTTGRCVQFVAHYIVCVETD